MTITIKSNPDGVTGAIQVNGVDAVTVDKTGITQGAPAGFRNKIINGAFGINQRGYVSGAATTAGQYTLDRWKVTGTGGITFSTVNNKTTVTIPAGRTLQQVIEGLNLATGTYVLSWEGTAQGKIGAGSYGASGITGSITGSTNTTIEFGPGTVANVQLELGSIATPCEHRPYGIELVLCQRYYQIGTTRQDFYASVSSQANRGIQSFHVVMRSSPTMAKTLDVISNNVLTLSVSGGSSYTSGYTYEIIGNTTGYVQGGFDWTATSEL